MSHKTKPCQTTILFLILMLPMLALSQQDTFTVLSYNIWNGYDFGKDEKRRAEVNQWIKEQQPDLVALQELVKYTPEKLAEDAKSWGHSYSVLLKKEGYSVGLTSNQPIELLAKIRENMHHGALHCRTNGVDVMVIHFSPFSHNKRRQEARIILDAIAEVDESSDQFIVLGDFNALSPMDDHLYSDGVLLNRMREGDKDKKNEGNLLDSEFAYATISAFMAYPMIDVVSRFTEDLSDRGSFPGWILGDGTEKSNQDLSNRLERIDFIFTSTQMARNCIDARVMNNKNTHFLSDHYPVKAVFKRP